MFESLEAAVKTNMKVTVLSVREYEHKGAKRKAIKVKKARGKKTHLVVQYENGMYSEGVSC